MCEIKGGIKRRTQVRRWVYLEWEKNKVHIHGRSLAIPKMESTS